MLSTHLGTVSAQIASRQSVTNRDRRNASPEDAMGIVVLELNIAAAREDYLRPVLYKWGEQLQSVHEKPFRAIGSTNPAADFQFFSAQRSFHRRQFETRLLRPSITLQTIAKGSE